jgi:hypothetical protein
MQLRQTAMVARGGRPCGRLRGAAVTQRRCPTHEGKNGEVAVGTAWRTGQAGGSSLTGEEEAALGLGVETQWRVAIERRWRCWTYTGHGGVRCGGYGEHRRCGELWSAMQKSGGAAPLLDFR